MDKLYTIIEVATKLGLSDKTLRRWEEAGRFKPSRTLGNQRRYSIEDLQILDAIKHGTIAGQDDLLTPLQASQICGVSSATIMRWENEGKIHPLITSGNTYYPRQKLMAKLDELKHFVREIEPEPQLTPVAEPTISDEPLVQQVAPPRLNKLVKPALSPVKSSWSLDNQIWNLVITLTLLICYHLIFNQSSTPISPQTPSTGAVQGASTTTQDPRLDDLLVKFQDHLSAELLKDAKPVPVTTIKLDNTSLVTGTATLHKNKNQVSIPAAKITPTTPVNVTFTSDFAPAKKYWVTPTNESFTLYTDFPVGADASFNYSFITPTSTPSATTTPSAVLR